MYKRFWFCPHEKKNQNESCEKSVVRKHDVTKKTRKLSQAITKFDKLTDLDLTSNTVTAATINPELTNQMRLKYPTDQSDTCESLR